MKKSKRVLVTFTSEQWDLIENLEGGFGNGDADVIRNVVISWLAEKSLISTNAKNKLSSDREINGRK
jgi:hypothetical protein